MRLSTKTRYGVRALFDIAYQSKGNPEVAVQAKDIAKRESLPLRYLEQIFQDLRRAGLVDSKRGPRGGYLLKRPPAEISLQEVVAALQGPVEEMFKVDEEEDVEPTCSTQVSQEIWKELAEHVGQWFSSISLQDLIDRGEELRRLGAEQTMYFI
jgi:Rrf2 family protein